MQVFARRTIVELRFKQSLEFFPKIDTVGNSILESFKLPHWRRAPHALELFDPARKMTFGMESGKLGCVLDSNDVNAEPISRAFELIRKAAELLGKQEFDRIGIRQWFARRNVPRTVAREARLRPNKNPPFSRFRH